MRPAKLACVLAVALALVLGASASPAGAMSCAGPQLLVASPAVAPGTTVVVSGWGFATCPASGHQTPLSDFELVVRVNDTEKAVGSIDFGSDFDFVLPVHIPPSLGTGEGMIIARWGQRPAVEARVPITVTGSPGDTGDRPYFTIDSRESSSPNWLWLGLAMVVGIAVGLTLASARRRRAT